VGRDAMESFSCLDALLESAFRDCCARRSRTGVDSCSFLPGKVPDAFANAPLAVLFALGIPRFSARLVAIEDWGSLRRDVGGVGDDVVEEAVRDVDVLGGRDDVEASEGCLVASGLFSLRGASLIKPASLWWWSSRRLRMRRACDC
jgi:hypothetical protein